MNYITKIHQEHQYLNLIRTILQNGEMKKGRNGYTKSIFGYQMRYNLRENTIPLLTTKKVAWKTCLKELLWFVSGDTSNHTLQKQNVKIWNGNSSREFLDSRGLYNNEEGDLGPVYGHQWRHFNAKYKDFKTDYSGQGVDQLQNIIDILNGKHKTDDKFSRRIILSAWNPCQLNEMALPPCHVLMQFHVSQNDELSCSLYQRSGDVGLGIPFNIASYSILTHLIAHHTGLKPGDFIHNLGDCHIYDDHIEQLGEQIEKEPYEFPTLTIKSLKDNIDSYVLDDFKLSHYKYHEKIAMKMRS